MLTVDSTQQVESQYFQKTVLAQFQSPTNWKSIFQISNSFLPFITLWYLMYLSLGTSYWLTLLLSVLTTGFFVRIFIIQHDCGHGSFFKSHKANEFWGTMCSIISLIPYHYWKKSHAIHHANAGKLEFRGIGDIYTMTVTEYLKRSRWGRFKYRLYRNPFVLFTIVPTFLFTVLYRFPVPNVSSLKPLRKTLHLTNLMLGIIVGGLIWLLGLKSFLLVQLPITVLSSSLGIWLFYVQHQFEDAYWSNIPSWEYSWAALQGSSYYKLPRILQWFTGNIGFHHVHHLSPKIPNYLLEKCHNENEVFQKVNILTLRTSLTSLKLRLWDEQQKKLISFAQLKQMQPEHS